MLFLTSFHIHILPHSNVCFFVFSTSKITFVDRPNGVEKRVEKRSTKMIFVDLSVHFDLA